MGLYNTHILPFLLTPSFLGGFDFLLDPSSGVTVVDGKISQMADAASGLVGQQPDAALRFLWNATGINGQPFLETNTSVKGALDFGNVLNMGTSSATFLVVGRSTAQNGVFVSKSRRTNISANIWRLGDESDALLSAYLDTSTGNASHASYEHFIGGAPTWSVTGYRIDRAAKLNSVWGQGAKLAEAAIAQDANYDMSSTARLLVGAHGDTSNTTYDPLRWLVGGIAWLVRYPFALTNEQMQEETAKLRKKFNI